MAGTQTKGEGTVWQRKDGKWCGEFTAGYGTKGKPRKVRVLGKTKLEARKKLDEKRRQHEQGLPLSPDNLTVAKHLDEWLERIKQTKAHNTWEAREQAIRLHLKPAFGKTKLKELTPAQIETLLGRLAQEGKSKNLILSVRDTLRCALRDAMKNGRVMRNVASLADLPKRMKLPTEKRALSPKEAEALMVAAQGDRFEAAIALMLSLGLRRGEAFGLKWEDIDYAKGEVRLQNNLQRVDGAWTSAPLKTECSRAALSMLPNLRALLKRHQAQQALDRRIMGDKWEEQGYVFTTDTGGPVPERTFSQHFERLLRDKGLSKITPHELRHSCASLLYAQGVDEQTAKEILRHSSIIITKDVYTHLRPDATAKALVGMDALLETG